MSGDDFLSRWSRRKLVAREEAQPRPNPEPPVETAAPEGEPEITPEEIAALPPIEELTLETDITAFLRKGVPEVLKNAALRRIWSLDPAIRDYVSEAREYAYDWNVPGGVPGNGPMLPGDDVDHMLATIFRDAERTPEASAASAKLRGPLSQGGEPDLQPHEPFSADEPRATADAAQHESDATPASDATDASSGQALLQDASGSDPAIPHGAPQSREEPQAVPAAPRRRHGGAFPV